MKNSTTTTTTANSTMTFEEYVSFDKKCSNPANLQWKDRVIEQTEVLYGTKKMLTDLEYEINKMIERHHRLTCLINFDRMYKRDKKFGPYVELIAESNSVTMFPVHEVKLSRFEQEIKELNIELKLLFNLRMKEIIK
mgnify:CR=1 FL=1